jgi:spore coat protein H
MNPALLRRCFASGAALLMAAALCGCGSEEQGLCSADSGGKARPAWWTKESHCPHQAAGYDEVFAEQVVHRVDIVVTAADYQATMDDLEDNYVGGSEITDLDGLPTPIWIPATITYNSKVWTEVGLRWKGHASLKGAFGRGVRKLSFSLEFDHNESSHPELTGQRFYGFKKLAFSNAYNDPSLLRDKTSAAIFRAAGVPAARSSFAPVYMDFGKGSVYLGLYTIVEDPGDRMLESQVGESGGNLYKPWGDAARWLSLAEVGETDIAKYWEKHTNEDTSDWSDAIAAISVLHGDRTDAAAWRTKLEEKLDIPAFVTALAVNQVIMNWDSYGCMHHNYLVYANPGNGGRFLWLPWDLNESMMDTTAAACVPPGSILLDEIVQGDLTSSAVDVNWPLIRFILGDSKYRADYLVQVQRVVDGAFAADKVIAQMQAEHDLIAPYVIGPEATEVWPYTNLSDLSEFTSSLEGGKSALVDHVKARHWAVEAALQGR